MHTLNTREATAVLVEARVVTVRRAQDLHGVLRAQVMVSNYPSSHSRSFNERLF